jgi:hypothetical protein
VNLPAATVADRRVLERINAPAEKQYETPLKMRGFLLFRLWNWQDRVGATDEEVGRVIDQLGLGGDDVHCAALEFQH